MPLPLPRRDRAATAGARRKASCGIDPLVVHPAAVFAARAAIRASPTGRLRAENVHGSSAWLAAAESAASSFLVPHELPPLDDTAPLETPWARRLRRAPMREARRPVTPQGRPTSPRLTGFGIEIIDKSRPSFLEGRYQSMHDVQSKLPYAPFHPWVRAADRDPAVMGCIDNTPVFFHKNYPCAKSEHY